jgi:hypothetical protein
METILPGRFRAAHPNQRGTCSAHPRVRPMGAGLVLRRKDGGGFQIDFMVSAMETVGSPIFFALARMFLKRSAWGGFSSNGMQRTGNNTIN